LARSAPVAKLEVLRVKVFREHELFALNPSASDTYINFSILRSLKNFFQGEEFSSP
jgi:hypothetical protein